MMNLLQTLELTIFGVLASFTIPTQAGQVQRREDTRICSPASECSERMDLTQADEPRRSIIRHELTSTRNALAVTTPTPRLLLNLELEVTTVELLINERQSSSAFEYEVYNASAKGEIQTKLAEAEDELLNGDVNDTAAALTAIHEAAENLCNYIHRVGAETDDETISGNMTMVHVKYIRPKQIMDNLTEDSYLVTDGLKRRNAQLQIDFRHSILNYCSEVDLGSDFDCPGICFTAIYYNRDILHSSNETSEIESVPIWETLLVGTNVSRSSLINGTDADQSFITIRLKIDQTLISNFTFKCGTWNTTTKNWDLNQCENSTIVQSMNESFIQCDCRCLGFYKLMYFREIEQNSSTPYTKPKPAFDYRLNVSFAIDGNYNQTVGENKAKFEKYIYAQIVEQLGDPDEFLYEIKKLTVWQRNGSTILSLLLELRPHITDQNNTAVGSVNNLNLLETSLLNGTLILTDMNNNTIGIPIQRVRRETLFRENDNDVVGWVILGTIIFVAAAAIIIAVRKHKREQEDSVRPMRTEQLHLENDASTPNIHKTIRGEVPDRVASSNYSVTTMSTSFNSLPSPGSEPRSINWHGNLVASAVGGELRSLTPSPVRDYSDQVRYVNDLDNISVISTRPMSAIDHSISVPPFPNSTMY